MKKIALLLLLSAVVLAPFDAALACDESPTTIYVNQTGWWRDPEAFNQSSIPIQHAINNATEGDTIIVKDGIYADNVDVKKRLTIKSENGSESTIAQAKNGDHVFEVTTDYVTISGFTVNNAKDWGKAGIYLKNVDHCTISDNNISDSYNGIYLRSSRNNTLSNNTASSNQDSGIHSDYGGNNIIVNNTISNNGRDGIRLWHSSNNNISSNTANSNNDYGIYLTSSATNTIYNNYFNNTENAYDDGTNIWNISKTLGKNIIGGSFLGGNYWSDYTGTDTDGDGLGETPYNIAGGTKRDYLPLVTTVTARISITLSKDIVQYGSLAAAENNTSPIINATNSGTVTETFYIRGDDAYYELSKWMLAESISPDTFTHEFCNFSSTDWYSLSNTTNKTLAPTIPIGGNASFMLRITLPTVISSPGVYTTNVTIIATEAH